MPRSPRDPPPRMFQGSELRRLMSMSFLLVILLMIIISSRAPNHNRLLIGRDGNHDQVVGKVVDDVEQPERVPAAPKSAAAAAITNTLRHDRTLALAQADGAAPEKSVAPNAKSSSTDSAAAPTPAAQPAKQSPSTATPPLKPQASSLKPQEPAKQSPSTATPAVSIPYNMSPAAPVETPPAEQKPAAPPVAANAIPPANGPTDEDLDESDPALEDFQYVEDGTIGVGLTEMRAYERMLRWVTNQSYARLAARAQYKKLNHSQIVAAANDRRGKLFQFTLHVRSMIPFEDKVHFYHSEDDPHEPVQVYDLWGDTGESRGRLYQLVVYDPPAGMPIGSSIHEDVQFAGYFFKVQGYEPGRAKPGAPPEEAPTFIGRVLWMVRPPTVLIHQADMWWIIGLGGSVLVILCGWFAWLFFRKGRPNVAQLSVDMTIPSTVSIDDWLEDSEHGSPDDRVRGDRRDSRRSDDFADDEAETEPEPTRNGRGNGHTRLFSDRPDSGQ